MQDPSFFAQINPTFPEQEHLKCPRCDSANTKFCYYNNYNLSQPRHFCKNCKRYWTKGGALRNIPVGGGSRKNTKRSSTTKKPSSSSPSPSSSSSSTAAAPASSATSTSSSTAIPAATSSSSKAIFGQDSRMISAPLGSPHGGHYGDLVNGLSQNGSKLDLGRFQMSGSGSGSGPDEVRTVDQQVGSVQNGGDNSAAHWNAGNDWPNLSIFTPGSRIQ